jgi:hypothetical protein
MDDESKMTPIEKIMACDIFHKHLKSRLDGTFTGLPLPNSMYQDMLDKKGEWFVEGEVEMPAQNVKWRDCIWVYTYKED